VPGWGITGARLTRDFSLDGFDQTVRLVNALCDIARREDHHPHVMFDFKHIRVEFWTHTADGVTRNDFICAKQLNTWMENNT
jgi:4a-hydroxytetrahydrobiopterin dehydratase